MAIELTVVQGDALATAADVLVVKHAQQPYGLDRAIVLNLPAGTPQPELPAIGQHLVLGGVRPLAAGQVLFLGVEPLHGFLYPQIRDFGRRALATLAERGIEARSVLLTLHGAEYGLDELEAFDSEVAGLLDAVRAGTCPPMLARVSIVERDAGRAARLAARLATLLPGGRLDAGAPRTVARLSDDTQQVLRSAGQAAAAKPHVFVAMPFAPAFDDLYHYGITGAVHAAGCLCERADLSAFTGDVMGWVQARIASARLVIAELTGANPNVYLEVGYAWALRVPTVLLVQAAAELKFDVRGQRVIQYHGSIRSLEAQLAQELAGLLPQAGAPAGVLG